MWNIHIGKLLANFTQTFAFFRKYFTFVQDLFGETLLYGGLRKPDLPASQRGFILPVNLLKVNRF